MGATIAGIGHCALEVLKDTGRARVLSRTSSGIFLATDQDNILFISDTKFRGPLTINLKDTYPERTLTQAGQTVHLLPNKILFPQSGWEIDLPPEAEVWQPKLKIAEPFVPVNILGRWGLFTQAFETRGAKGKTNTSVQVSNIEDEYLRKQEKIGVLLRGCKLHELEKALQALVGHGEGLTPQGDDFICGFTLACHYHPGKPAVNPALDAVLARVIDFSRKATTTLSWNLMRCAAQGSADERLLKSIAWLVNREGSLKKKTEELHTYGSSSGIETLRGFICFIENFESC